MKIKLFFTITLIISLLSVQKSLSQLRHPWELVMKTRNGSRSITFHINSTSAKVWEPHRSYINYTYLTTESKYVNPDDITMAGTDTSDNNGWNSDNYPSNEDPFLGRGVYKITVEGKNAELNVDCYGTDFKGDITVLYDYSQDKFYVNNREVTSINLYDDAAGLQPTAPSNLQCTNPTSNGANPHFTWTSPNQPTGVSFSYYIYRDTGSGFQHIGTTSSTSYTDTGVEIDKFGSTTYYYVKAKGSHSPLSAASNTVELRTDTASKGLPGNGSDQNQGSEGEKNLLGILSVYPNPFNPETKISYNLPRESRVTLSVYNIAGQKIATLIAEQQSAGTHTAIFDGKSLPAGIYLVNLQVGREKHLQKVLLVK